jgi:hypothetical protein
MTTERDEKYEGEGRKLTLDQNGCGRIEHLARSAVHVAVVVLVLSEVR